MGNIDTTLQTFEQLDAYKAAREFRKAMYGISRRLPAFERFELGSQIRRAAVSLTNNIAEGHGRYHYLDQIRFMLQARGSGSELIDDLNICFDEAYIPADELTELKQQSRDVFRLLNGYIRWLRDRKLGQAPALREEPSPYGEKYEDIMI